MQKKIDCSYYNALAINEKEELYIWGSLQSGILGIDKFKAQEVPRKFPLEKVNPFFKAIQVSCGPNHVAVLVANRFLDKVDTNKYIDPLHKGILKKQADILRKEGINFIIEYNLAERQVIPKEEFLQIIESHLHYCDYTPEEEEEIPNLADYFTAENNSEINLVQYAYCLDPSLFETNKVVTWGLKDNGKLGQGKYDDYLDENEAEALKNLNSDEPSVSNQEVQSLLKKAYLPPQVIQIANPVKKVCCGHKFTLALDLDGFLWTWGKGSNGCLGTGKLIDAYEPIMIEPKTFGKLSAEIFITDIAAGAEHCLALNLEGNVYSWGNGKFGRLGHGNEVSQLLPTKIDFFVEAEVKIRSVECGEIYSTCIARNDGIYTWGCGANYRLGHGSLNDELIPRVIINMAEYYICQISCGLLHTMCLTVDGHIFAWGCGAEGRLAIDMVSDQDYLVPTRVGNMNDEFKKKEFAQICAGPNQSFALTRTGELYSWGSRKFKTLGIQDLKHNVYFPVALSCGPSKFFNQLQTEKLEGHSKNVNFDTYELDFQADISPHENPFDVVKVIGGENNTGFLMANGDLYIAGSGSFGQLGFNPDLKKDDMKAELTPNIFWEDELFYSFTPMYIPANLSIKFKHVTIGLNHVTAISTEGKAYAWGKNSEGQLGIGSMSKFVNKPTLIEDISLKSFAMCIASHTYSSFLSVEGEIFVCGTSEYGCLGVNNQKQNYDILSPKLVNNIPPVKYIAGGPHHMVAISNDGYLFVWGNSNHGRLGFKGKKIKILVPKETKVVNNHGPVRFKQASCGFMHTMLLDTEGYIWGAGAKAYAGFPSEDGYRTIEEQDIFKIPPDLATKKFIQISSGDFHNLALTEDGNEVYGWGKSENGKLAQDTFMSFGDKDSKLKNILLPKRIEGLENMVQVSCGVNHSLCLSSSGQVYVWGCVLNGRLGIAKEELSFLKQLRLLKNDHNILSLNTPHELKTDFEEEFEQRIHIFTHEGKKEFLGISTTVSKKASAIVAEMERKQQEIEKARLYGRLDEETSPKMAELILLKQFTSPELKPKQTIGTDLLQVEHQATRGSSDVSNKKVATPVEGSNQSSPLLSATRKDDVMLSGKIPAQSRFSLSPVPIDVSLYPKQNVTFNESAIVERERIESPIDARLSYMRSSSSKRNQHDVNYSYMTAIDNHPKEIVEEQLEIQKLLQEEENDCLELNLTSRENSLTLGFESLFSKVSSEMKKIRAGISNRILEVENVIQTSFTCLPKKIKQIKNLPHTIPSFILQNIQIYEGIISALYNHPCYFHKMIKSGLIEKNIVLDWAFKVYGSQMDDDRSINLVLTLALMLLEEEVESYSLKQQSVIRLMASFVKLYNFIQEYQHENMNFIKEIAEHLLLNIVIRDNHPDYNIFRNSVSAKNKQSEEGSNQYTLEENDREIFLGRGEVEYVRDLFNIEYYIKHRHEADTNKAGRLIKRCLSMIKKFESYLKSLLMRPDFCELGKMSPQIRFFNHKIIEEYKKAAIKKATEKERQNDVDTSSNARRAELLVMDIFFGKIAEVIVNYKDYGIKIPREYEDILSPQNLENIAMLITKYFQKEEIAQGHHFTPLNDYITITSKSTKVVANFIKGMTSYVDTNVTAESLLRAVEDSLKLKEKYIYKLTVKDIINIQNFLTANRNNLKVLLRGSDDPLYVLTEYLKDYYLSLNNFSFDMLAYKVTIKVNTKIIEGIDGEETPKFSRCNFCQLVLPQHLLRIEDVNMLKDKQWTCNYDNCEQKNDFSRKECEKCGHLIQEYKYQPRFLFKRHLPLIAKNKILSNYIYFLKSSNRINKHASIIHLLEDKIETSIKQDNFKSTSEYSDILQFFQNFDFRKFGIYYSLSLKRPNSPDQMISLFHEIFADEYKLRKLHKKLLDQLEKVLNRGFQILANEVQNYEITNKTMEDIAARVAVAKAKYMAENDYVAMKSKLNMEGSKPYATFTSAELKRKNVLANFLLHEKYVPKVIDNLKFYVTYRKFEGFHIKIVFMEDSLQNLLVRFGPRFNNEVGLDELVISPEHFLEMRRTINNKAETTIGYSTFNVENLVNLLNDILMKSNTRKMQINKK